jgi:hypothetical protein
MLPLNNPNIFNMNLKALEIRLKALILGAFFLKNWFFCVKHFVLTFVLIK